MIDINNIIDFKIAEFLKRRFIKVIKLMEVVTYHYVRKYDKRLKYFRFLEFKILKNN